MNRAYIMLCDDSFWTLQEAAEWADQSALVRHWRHDMLGSLYLLSAHSASELSKDFQKSADRKGPFIFAAVEDEVAGVMLPETWSILHDKRPLIVPPEAEKVPVEGEKLIQAAGPR